MGNLGFQELLLIVFFLVIPILIVVFVVRLLVKRRASSQHVVDRKDILLERLSRLQSLREQGTLTEEVYERERQTALNELERIR